MIGGEWVPVAVGVVGVGATVAGALVFAHRATVGVLVDQIKARTVENDVDRGIYQDSVKSSNEALVAVAGSIRELVKSLYGDRKISDRRHKELCECLKRLSATDWGVPSGG